MVRILGCVSIGFSRQFDDGFRLTHYGRCRAKQPVNVRACSPSDRPAERLKKGQPALAPSQPMGSTSPPLTQTSKWRWFAVERPVLPT